MDRVDRGHGYATADAGVEVTAATSARVNPGAEGVSDADVTATAPKAPALRRDAERNRQLILSTAKAAFAQRGFDATLNEIAKEAGLGVGTVYRRFPTIEALIDAVSADAHRSIERIIDETLAMPKAWDGLHRFMAMMLEFQIADKGLRDVVMARHGNDPAKQYAMQPKIDPAVRDLVSRAQAEGDLRPDVTATDIGVLLVGALSFAEFTALQPGEVWRRHLSLLLDGLRHPPGAARPVLEQPPLDPGQIDECLNGWTFGGREVPRERQKSS